MSVSHRLSQGPGLILSPRLATQRSYLTHSAPVPGGQEPALHSINCLTHTPTTIPESCKFINNLFLRPSLMASPHIIMLHTLLFGCVYGHALQCTGSPASISLFSTFQFTFFVTFPCSQERDAAEEEMDQWLSEVSQSPISRAARFHDIREE